MLEVFFPDMSVDRVQDIDLNKLIKNNIKGLILDIDNTLVASDIKIADEGTINWIKKVKDTMLSVCIVSNGSKKRVNKFNENLNIPAIHRASKPSSKAFKASAKLMGTKLNETAVIGDQLFTDIYGGKKIGMYAILVKPIDKREFFFVSFKRLLERPILKRYYKKIKDLKRIMEL